MRKESKSDIKINMPYTIFVFIRLYITFVLNPFFMGTATFYISNSKKRVALRLICSKNDRFCDLGGTESQLQSLESIRFRMRGIIYNKCKISKRFGYLEYQTTHLKRASCEWWFLIHPSESNLSILSKESFRYFLGYPPYFASSYF